MNNRIGRIAWFVMALTVVSCGSAKEATRAKKSETTTTLADMAPEVRFDFTKKYLDACREKILGNTDKAITLFEECLAIDPNNDAAHYELASLLYAEKNFNAAIGHVEQAIAVSKEINEWYYVLKIEILQKMENHALVAESYQLLIRNFPERSDFYHKLALAYQRANLLEKALEVYDQIETQQNGPSESTAIRKHRIYVALSQYDNALTVVKDILKDHPNSTLFLNLLADTYLLAGAPDEGLKVYKRVVEIDPYNGKAHLALADFYKTAGDRKKSNTHLRTAFEQNDISIDKKIQVLLAFYQRTEIDKSLLPEAYGLMNILKENHPRDGKVWAMYGDFMKRERKWQEAVIAYEKAVELAPGKFPIWKELLQCCFQAEEYQVLINHSERALEFFPSQPEIYLYSAIGLIKLEKYEEAEEQLQAGVMLIADNNRLKAEFQCNLGLIYFHMEDFGSFKASYDNAVSLDSNSVYIKMNYAYYLAEFGKNIEQAKAMIEGYLDKYADNSLLLDTYGWVLFKSGDSNQSLEWILKAKKLNKEPIPRIEEHLGDIYYSLNKKEKAFYHWNLAKKMGYHVEEINAKLSKEGL